MVSQKKGTRDTETNSAMLKTAALLGKKKGPKKKKKAKGGSEISQVVPELEESGEQSGEESSVKPDRCFLMRTRKKKGEPHR